MMSLNAIKTADGAERFEFKGEVYDIPPTTIRPQARHKGELTTDIKVAFTHRPSLRRAWPPRTASGRCSSRATMWM